MSSRIATSQLFDAGRQNIERAKDRLAADGEKAASLKILTRPSQNPSGWMIVNQLKEEQSSSAAMANNASMATHFLTATDNALAQIQEKVQRAHELAVSAASSTQDGTRGVMVGEVRALFDGIVQTLNTNYQGKALFGGFQTDKPPFDAQGEYHGDEGRIQIEIAPGQRLDLNVLPQDEVLGRKGGVNVVQALRAWKEGFEKNDVVAIRASLDTLFKASDQLSTARADVGARVTSIQGVIETHATKDVQTAKAISGLEDADAAKVFSDLARNQIALKAAIASGEKLMNEIPTDMLFK